MKVRPLQKRIGDAVRKRREALGVSQEGFADQIPMHRTYYGAVERGEKNLQLSTLERVCASLDVPMWEVIRDAERAE
jgi:transcriptional regulator with XRE-family HTH domain